MPSSYKIAMNDRVFSVSFPVPHENEFVKYRPSVDLHDEALFSKSGGVTALKVHWKYHSGLFRKVAGVLEMQVFVRAAKEYDVASEDGLKNQLHVYLKQELAKINYRGNLAVQDKVLISGRSWLSYRIPVVGADEYSTGLSPRSYLSIQFHFIDNTGEKSPAWHKEANELKQRIIESIRIN